MHFRISRFQANKLFVVPYLPKHLHDEKVRALNLAIECIAKVQRNQAGQ